MPFISRGPEENVGAKSLRWMREDLRTTHFMAFTFKRSIFQIERVEIAGEKAPEPSNELTEFERTYIGLGVASGIIALIILVIITGVRKKTKIMNDCS